MKMLLRARFGFDRWHLFTLTEREYAKDIIRYCNGRQSRDRFAEIGCGLGDISRNVRFGERYGYDSDESVLKAARFLSRITGQRKIWFAPFCFPASPLSGNFDVILLVNWIHLVEPAVLKKGIEDYFSCCLCAGGAIIIDTVQDPEYRYNHDIRYLTAGIPAIVTSLGEYERQRQIWLIKKN